jgi:hypothetical protein
MGEVRYALPYALIANFDLRSHAAWISKKIKDSISVWPEELAGGVIFRRNAIPTGALIANFSNTLCIYDSPMRFFLLGVLMDDAMKLVKIPEATELQLQLQFKLTTQDALRYGLTMITDSAFQAFSFPALKK